MSARSAIRSVSMRRQAPGAFSSSLHVFMVAALRGRKIFPYQQIFLAIMQHHSYRSSLFPASKAKSKKIRSLADIPTAKCLRHQRKNYGSLVRPKANCRRISQARRMAARPDGIIRGEIFHGGEKKSAKKEIFCKVKLLAARKKLRGNRGAVHLLYCSAF